MNGFFFRRQLDPLDFVELFDAALHLLGFCRLIAEAVDEGFELLDVFPLIPVGRFELRAPLRLSAADISRNCRG